MMRVSPVSRSIAPCRFSRSRPTPREARSAVRAAASVRRLCLAGRMTRRRRRQPRPTERVAQIPMRVDELLLVSASILSARIPLPPVEADAFISLISPERHSHPEPLLDELPTSVVDVAAPASPRREARQSGGTTHRAALQSNRRAPHAAFLEFLGRCDGRVVDEQRLAISRRPAPVEQQNGVPRRETRFSTRPWHVTSSVPFAASVFGGESRYSVGRFNSAPLRPSACAGA